MILPVLGRPYTKMFKLPPGISGLIVGPNPIEVHTIGPGIMFITRKRLRRLADSCDVAH